MKTILVRNYDDMSRVAAEHIADSIRKKSDAVLGLATGSTPMGMYQVLVEMYNQGKIDFSQVKTFNLDEYVGLSPQHSRSYHAYMANHLFSHVNMDPDRIYIPNGLAQDLQKECVQYDQALIYAGGIDLQILGIGENGHIGFNEPGSSPNGNTSVVQLARSTIQANSRFFDKIEDVPQHAITVGIGTILTYSKQIILMANGKEKAEAIRNMIEQEPNMANPASYLKLHKDVTIIVDEMAAQHIQSSTLV